MLTARLSRASPPFPIALIVGLILAISCTSVETAASQCADVAGAAGVPRAVVQWIQTPPEDLGRVERVTIRRAVEEFDLQPACGETLLALEQDPERNDQLAVPRVRESHRPQLRSSTRPWKPGRKLPLCRISPSRLPAQEGHPRKQTSM